MDLQEDPCSCWNPAIKQLLGVTADLFRKYDVPWGQDTVFNVKISTIVHILYNYCFILFFFFTRVSRSIKTENVRANRSTTEGKHWIGYYCVIMYVMFISLRANIASCFVWESTCTNTTRHCEKNIDGSMILIWNAICMGHRWVMVTYFIISSRGVFWMYALYVIRRIS